MTADTPWNSTFETDTDPPEFPADADRFVLKGGGRLQVPIEDPADVPPEVIVNSRSVGSGHETEWLEVDRDALEALGIDTDGLENAESVALQVRRRTGDGMRHAAVLMPGDAIDADLVRDKLDWQKCHDLLIPLDSDGEVIETDAEAQTPEDRLDPDARDALEAHREGAE